LETHIDTREPSAPCGRRWPSSRRLNHSGCSLPYLSHQLVKAWPQRIEREWPIRCRRSQRASSARALARAGREKLSSGLAFAGRPPSVLRKRRMISRGAMVSFQSGTATAAVFGTCSPNSPGHSQRTPSTRSSTSYTPKSVPAQVSGDSGRPGLSRPTTYSAVPAVRRVKLSGLSLPASIPARAAAAGGPKKIRPAGSPGQLESRGLGHVVDQRLGRVAHDGLRLGRQHHDGLRPAIGNHRNAGLGE